MPPANRIDQNEFRMMRDYIEKSCGIHITEDKMYLVETRLTTLMVENGCSTFMQFYQKATADKTNGLRDKIVDAMTTNETLWFRDKSPFEILDSVLLDRYVAEIKSGKRSKVRIWSAASSTGQEPYSIAMVILDYIRRHPGLRSDQFDILATDISPSVLFLAMAGRYDNLAISRGMDDSLKSKYFTQNGKVWAVRDEVKNMVTFKKLNLQEPLAVVGKRDIVFCRNVLIYFADTFKRDILKRIAQLLRPDGFLFLGASESIINYTSDFQMQRYTRGLYYQAKASGAVYANTIR
ncbi:MAG: hypothetical protein GF398_03595 [Chitinivibrionales bacterium]|nr:hypothetical protein [Chitinivibrionales bacterium]